MNAFLLLAGCYVAEGASNGFGQPGTTTGIGSGETSSTGAGTESSSSSGEGSESGAGPCGGASVNACGGCVVLDMAPGTDCVNEFGCASSMVCDGRDAVRCDPEPRCDDPGPGPRRVIGVDFDDGTIGSFGANNDAVVVVDVGVDGVPCSSGKCVQLNHNGAVAWNDPYATNQIDSSEWTTTSEMLVRWRMRIDADHDALAGQGGNKSSRLLGQGIDNSILYTDPNGFLLATGTQFTDGSYIPYLYGGPLDTEWHDVAYYYRLEDPGQANGRVRIWWDGELVGDYDGRITRHTTATSQYITFPSNWSTNDNPDWVHDAVNHMYVDEIEVFYDGDMGTPTTGSMLDNTIVAE